LKKKDMRPREGERERDRERERLKKQTNEAGMRMKGLVRLLVDTLRSSTWRKRSLKRERE